MIARRDWHAVAGVLLFLALYAVVGTIEARDAENARPVALVAR